MNTLRQLKMATIKIVEHSIKCKRGDSIGNSNKQYISILRNKVKIPEIILLINKKTNYVDQEKILMLKERNQIGWFFQNIS